MKRVIAAVAVVVAAACSATGRPASTSSPAPSPPATSVPSGPALSGWLTYMADAARSGRGPDTPAARSVTQAWTKDVDGAVYASPVVAADRVFIATENNTVYAFDAASGAEAWHRHFGDPVPRSALACGNIDPTGITSTPVVDAAGHVVFVVGFINGSPRPVHRLFALSLEDGAVRWQRTVDPPGGDPLVHQQRGALALAGGRVYIPYGGLLGDCGSFRGTIVGVPADGGGNSIAYVVAAARQAGIWSPPGEVIDPMSGDVYTATGNQDLGRFGQGNSVVRLSPGLELRDYWAPTDWAQLSLSDTDLGSTTPVLLPAGLIFQSGKNGTGYLLRANDLGHIGGQAFSAQACSTAVFGGVAVVPSGDSGADLYLPCGGIQALHVSSTGPRFDRTWRSTLGGETPILAYGWLWTVSRGSGELIALDPGSGQLRGRSSIGRLTAHFATPAAFGGRVFVSGSTRAYAFTVG